VVLNARGRWLAIVGLVAVTAVATLVAQREKPGVDDSMSALVDEIRALRLTIERSMVANSQAQLLLGRVQLQEIRLATLGRQLQEARTRTTDAQLAQSDVEAQLRRLVGTVDEAHAPEERQAIQQRIAELKEQVKLQSTRTAQLRSDESAALEALTAEQNRWATFNERLEALERVLAQATER
jgi:hypothetical protein